MGLGVKGYCLVAGVIADHVTLATVDAHVLVNDGHHLLGVVQGVIGSNTRQGLAYHVLREGGREEGGEGRGEGEGEGGRGGGVLELTTAVIQLPVNSKIAGYSFCHEFIKRYRRHVFMPMPNSIPKVALYKISIKNYTYYF